MSPEQANGLPLDARSDIYALGVVLFELITGREPYQAETPMALLLKHINEPLPPIKTYREDVPEAVEQVVAKATAKDPNQRFSSAGDMARSFQEALHTTPPTRKAKAALDEPATYVPAPATPPPMSIPAAAPMTDTAPAVERRGNPLLLIGGVVAVLIVAGVIAALALGGNNPPPTPTPAPPTDVPSQALVPTPFDDAQTIRTDRYTVSIPREWIPPQGYLDLSDDERLVHLWQDPNLNFYVAVEMIEGNDLSDPEEFQDAIEEFNEDYIATRPNLTPIDETTFPDGTVRHSFRLEGPSDSGPNFPPGQLDLFYLNRDPYLVVLNMYSSDSLGNELIDTFQAILDSLRITSEST